jgi:type I restriction enzyme S subunit
MSETPLKRVASVRVSNVDKKSIEGESPVRLCNYTDVYYRNDIEADQDFTTATASSAQIAAFRLDAGDVIITKDSETAEDIGVPAYVRSAAPDLVCGYHLAMIRPSTRVVHDRFLFWFMSSTITRERLAVAATGVTRFGLRSDSIGNLRMPSWPLHTQRAIADYLDTETTRIDDLIAKKHRLRRLLDEWEQSAMLSIVGDWRRGTTVSLRQLGASVTTGPFGTQLSATEYVRGGIPVINPTHVQRGAIVPEESVSVPPAVARRLQRHRLRREDLILGRKGDVGRAATVTNHQAGWVCGSDCIAVRVPQDRIRTPILAALLHIDLYRQQLEARSTGAMVASLNEGTLLSFRMPALNPAAQAEALGRLDRVRVRRDMLENRLGAQVALLREHRQALITAAVTGELEIPGAA